MSVGEREVCLRGRQRDGKPKNEGENEKHGRVIRGETNWLIFVRNGV